MADESLHPFVKSRQRRRFAHQIVRLVIGVELANSNVGVAPKRIRRLNAGVAALPDEALIGAAFLMKRLLRGIKPGFVAKDLWSSLLVEVSSALIAVAEERSRPPLQVIAAQFLPLRGALQRLG